MKGLLVALFCLVASALSAQKLVVRDFRHLPTDQTALNRETGRTDHNGNRAALIKIYTSLKLTDLAFGGSVQDFTEIIQKPGQIWLYLPSRSQKVEISHARYNPVRYDYEDEIRPGNTYSMVLTVEGKEVTLAASTDGADLTVDGDTVGRSPLRVYLPYGPHVVKAQLGTLVFEDRLDVLPDGADSFELQMTDEDLKYGDVTVTVADNAEIWFMGKREGVGEATFHLKEGLYPFEARKKNADPRTTSVTVEAGRRLTVPLNTPYPHKGYLEVGTEPYTGVDIVAGDTVFSTAGSMQLPVGQYELTFAKRGYYPQTRTYIIKKDSTVRDLVSLVRKQYVKPVGLYGGVGFAASKMPGVKILAGGTWHGFDLSVGYSFGVTKSDPVSWFSDDTQLFAGSSRYRMDELTVKAGYQFSFVERFGLVPQAGYMAQMLHGGDGLGDGFTCHSISAGAKATYVPVPRIGVFVNPEYAIPVKSSEQYRRMAELGGFTRGGFHCTVGVFAYIL